MVWALACISVSPLPRSSSAVAAISGPSGKVGGSPECNSNTLDSPSASSINVVASSIFIGLSGLAATIIVAADRYACGSFSSIASGAHFCAALTYEGSSLNALE